ncbi:MAG: hypothetical protein KME60_25130 [Cyanomargarita calcarea GSE-NOS-MK-12-04C]|jgi:hypothetical protein|uniref:Uncharacterized protein n=1 Tax=Cyanomargarita calcarea GSE-NOS-MK-12-04C TaxID=2839659 RepID=A0A951QRB8_9CYAN|nr:hypothetical protein [Cyanomargarita calcarea GSE-NOS-MK-12-04C]
MKIFENLTRRTQLGGLIFAASLIVVLAIGCLPTPSQPSTRDKYLWPFASTSPWNMPIGSNAKYVPANIGKAHYAGADPEYFFKLKEGDPLRPIYAPGAWGEGRCTGTQAVGISLPIPDDLIVPDATKVPFSTPNNASAFLMPDGKTLVQLGPLARCQPGGSIYGWHFYRDENIYGQGLGGSHFGSGLSAIGGSIRKGELTSKQPIRHALKVVIWGEKYLYYSKDIPGRRWPAELADGNAANQYHGKNPALVQGSLLAIPPKITESSLNLQTSSGKKLFHALQDYGAYVADDAGWDGHHIAIEKGVLEEFRAANGYDFEGTNGQFYNDYMQLFQVLEIVDNNGPDSIGGGGTPRAALAPPIGN